jgi:hypothetical protein
MEQVRDVSKVVILQVTPVALTIVGVILTVLPTENASSHAGGVNVTKIIAIAHHRPGLSVNKTANIALILIEYLADLR